MRIFVSQLAPGVRGSDLATGRLGVFGGVAFLIILIGLVKKGRFLGHGSPAPRLTSKFNYFDSLIGAVISGIF